MTAKTISGAFASFTLIKFFFLKPKIRMRNLENWGFAWDVTQSKYLLNALKDDL